MFSLPPFPNQYSTEIPPTSILSIGSTINIYSSPVVPDMAEISSIIVGLSSSITSLVKISDTFQLDALSHTLKKYDSVPLKLIGSRKSNT